MGRYIQFTLNVNEGKWLIAYGIAALPEFQKALDKSTVFLKGGTTVSCLSELLVHYPMRVCGRTSMRGTVSSKFNNEAAHSLCIRNGEIENVDDLVEEAVMSLGPGDVAVIGANIYDQYGNAAMLSGTPGGNACGRATAAMATEGCKVLIAVGLEKFAPGNLNETISKVRRKGISSSRGMSCGLFPLTGTVFTEIDAIHTIADVDVILIGKGGIGGAEGGCVFQVSGKNEEVSKIEDILSLCYGKTVSGDAESLIECEYPCSSCGRHLSCCYKKEWQQEHKLLT